MKSVDDKEARHAEARDAPPAVTVPAEMPQLLDDLERSVIDATEARRVGDAEDEASVVEVMKASILLRLSLASAPPAGPSAVAELLALRERFSRDIEGSDDYDDAMRDAVGEIDRRIAALGNPDPGPARPMETETFTDDEPEQGDSDDEPPSNVTASPKWRRHDPDQDIGEMDPSEEPPSAEVSAIKSVLAKHSFDDSTPPCTIETIIEDYKALFEEVRRLREKCNALRNAIQDCGPNRRCKNSKAYLHNDTGHESPGSSGTAFTSVCGYQWEGAREVVYHECVLQKGHTGFHSNKASEPEQGICWSCGGKGYIETSGAAGHYGYGRHYCSRCAGTGKTVQPEQGDGDPIEAWRESFIASNPAVDEVWPDDGVEIMRRLEQERDEARKFGEKAAAQHNDLLRKERILTCAFCGHDYAEGTPVTRHESLTAHVMECKEHPLRAKLDAAEKRATKLDSSLTSQGILLGSVSQDRAQVEADRDALKADLERVQRDCDNATEFWQKAQASVDALKANLGEAVSLLRIAHTWAEARFKTDNHKLWHKRRDALLARCKERE